MDLIFTQVVGVFESHKITSLFRLHPDCQVVVIYFISNVFNLILNHNTSSISLPGLIDLVLIFSSIPGRINNWGEALTRLLIESNRNSVHETLDSHNAITTWNLLKLLLKVKFRNNYTATLTILVKFDQSSHPGFTPRFASKTKTKTKTKTQTGTMTRQRQRHRQRQWQDKDNHGEVRPIKSPRL